MPIPPLPNRKVNLQHAMQMEAERKRELDRALREHFYVVKEGAEEGRRRGRVVGIDLGTTNSCLCYINEETLKPKIIPSPTGSWVFPTAVTFDKNHQVRLYGEEARACVRSSASATLCSGKRLIGRGFGELGRVRGEMSRTNILSLDEKGDLTIEVMGRTYTVLHIIAMFLRFLKNEAEKFLKEPVDMAVVSVPAYFTPQQKVATEDAALAAGFDVLEIIDEPSAACLTYTTLSEAKRHACTAAAPIAVAKRVVRSLVFDLGGGTLDCAVMEHNQSTQLFRMVATHGDPLLGGNDWDAVIMQHFALQFQEKWSIPIEDEDGNIGQSVQAFRSLQLEAERAKIHFTHSTETYYGYNRSFHFSERLRDIIPLEATLTHAEYIDMTRPLRVRCLECITKLFNHVSLRPEDIDHVLLVGAMTRDPPIRHMLEEFFGKPVASESTCPADYAVAIGAAIRGGMLQGKYPVLARRTRFVTGTIQSLRQGGFVRRSLGRLRHWVRPANPNATGTRWRGKARGLSDDEIANYAKELVEFETACARRQLLERAEDEANFIMRRVATDSNRKQGNQERRVTQLAEQLKFWQYMVHNFHDHETELLKTVKELESTLDEIEGLAADASSGLTAAGTIDFSETVKKTINRSLGLPDTPPSTTAEGKDVPTDQAATQPNSDTSAGGLPSTTDASPTLQQPPGTPSTKVLRRTIPLPSASVEAAEIVEAGHPALRNADIPISESTRTAFLENTVEERAWREPPTPPGESGSWAEVKAAMDAGEAVGSPLPLSDLIRPMTFQEMLETLLNICPIDDPASKEHARRREEGLQRQTMTIVSGAVEMAAIEAAIDVQRVDAEQEVLEQQQRHRDRAKNLSAQLYR